MSERTVFTALSPGRAGPGTQLNDLYEIDELLAAGGMGEVFRGHAIETGDPVAIKTIRPEFAGNAQALALFRKEAGALRDVHHGAVVRYYVFSIDRRLDLPYLAMEFVTGQSLAERLRTGPLPFAEVEILRRRLAGGLQAAHEAGIVHRDVSPDNVILPAGDPARAKIIDFGIARTATGHTVIGDGFAGKYDYVSPEQLGLQGGDVTARSDIYSLGLVLAQASRGRPVDMGASPADFVARRSALPDLTGIDARLRPLLDAMLQPDPRRRPDSMAEVEAWRPAVPRAPSGNGRGRLRLLALGGGAAGLALVAAAALLWSQSAPNGPMQPVVAPLAEKPAPTSPERAPETDQDRPRDGATPAKRTTDTNRNDVAPEAGPASDPQQGPAKDDRPGRSGVPPSAERTADSAREAPAPTEMERVASYIRDYRGGPCFFLSPTTVGSGDAAVEAFGTIPEPFRVFDAAFKKQFGFEARIQLRQIEAGQCPVLELIGAQARAKAASVPILRVDGDRIRSGEELRGSIEPGNVRNLRLLLVEGDGTVHDLTSDLKRSQDRTLFAIRLQKPASDAWRPQLLVAVAGAATQNPAQAGAAQHGDVVFSALARLAASPEGAPGIAVRYIKVGG